jgi:predicted HD phosphohydrolase
VAALPAIRALSRSYRRGVPIEKKMHFRHMDEGTDADFALLAEIHGHNIEALPGMLLGLLGGLRSDQAYPVDRLTHSLQSATLALRDERDEEYVVCCLLHDLGESLGPFNHGEVIAAILRPFVSADNYWMLAHHPAFQTYFYGSHLGIDPNERDVYIDSPYYDRTVEFCARYDEVAFDASYRNEPLSTFEPMVRRVLHKEWTPPS